MPELQIPGLRGKKEAQLVKAPSRVAGPVFQVGIGQGAEFRHPPGAEEQIRGPAVVPQGGVHRVEPEAQGLGGTVADAVKVLLVAGGPETQVTLGLADEFAHPGVHPVGADLHTGAALDALGLVAPHPPFGQRVPEPAGGAHWRPGPGAPGFIVVFHRMFRHGPKVYSERLPQSGV